MILRLVSWVGATLGAASSVALLWAWYRNQAPPWLSIRELIALALVSGVATLIAVEEQERLQSEPKRNFQLLKTVTGLSLAWLIPTILAIACIAAIYIFHLNT